MKNTIKPPSFIYVKGNPVDRSLEECRTKGRNLIKQGWTIHQKFTCVNCKDRQRVEEENRFFPYRECSKCGAVTDIEKQGCGFDADKTNFFPGGDG